MLRLSGVISEGKEKTVLLIHPGKSETFLNRGFERGTSPSF
jgi:hypothetical protein